MGDIQDTLLSLAEVSVALAGFSAIVVVLKRNVAGSWSAVDADQFHGMVIHAICAVVFCLLPSIIDVVVQDMVTTLHIACALLGTQMVVHSLAVMFFSTSAVLARALLSFGVVFGLVQFLAFTDWGVQREFQFYTVGIIWHIFQAGVLFVLLVWIPRESIESDTDG